MMEIGKEDKRKWDKKAEFFARMEVVPKDNEFISLVRECCKGELEGASILDIGCGTGIWSLALADEVGKVTGVDISDTMIAYANRNKEKIGAENASFIVSDWADMESGKGILAEKYDIVLMHMTPAIRSIEDADKAVSACRGYCFYTSGFSHSFPLRQSLESRCSRPPFRGHRDLFFDLLKHVADKGMKPFIAYDTAVYDQEFGLEECISENSVLYPELDRKAIEEAIAPFVKDGRVYSHSEMTHMTAYWRVL